MSLPTQYAEVAIMRPANATGSQWGPPTSAFRLRQAREPVHPANHKCTEPVLSSHFEPPAGRSVGPGTPMASARPLDTLHLDTLHPLDR